MNDQEKKAKQNAEQTKESQAKTNKYTPEEKPFADGEGTKLDQAIDQGTDQPATRGE